MESTEPKKKNSFKTSKHPDWGVKSFSYQCWFIGMPGVDYDDSVPLTSRFVPQSVWNTGKAMHRFKNTLYQEFKALRDTEPLECANGHRLTHEQVYTDPKKKRARFCGVCKADNGDKENYVRVWAVLRGKERFEHYRPVFELLKSPVGCYRLFLNAETTHIEQLPDLAIEERKKMIQALHLHPPCYEDVVNRFRDTLQQWMSNPQMFDPPRFKSEFDSIRLPFKDKSGGKPADLFINSGGKWAGVVDTRHLEPKANHHCPTCGEWLNIVPHKATAKCKNGHEHEQPAPPEKPQEYLFNGYFMLGPKASGERLNLHVAYNRPLTPHQQALVKAVALVGKHVRPRGWRWKIVFSVQAPYPIKPRERDCVTAFDFSWRHMSSDVMQDPASGKEIIVAPDRIRIAAVYDGHCWHEVYLPTDLTRRRDAKAGDTSPGGAGRKITPKESRAMDGRIGEGIQRCKEALAATDQSEWPEAAKRIWQRHKRMRQRGLFSIRKELAAAGIVIKELEDWNDEYGLLSQRNRHIQIKLVNTRTNFYRNLVDGIVKQSRAIILDGLKIKEKAERPRRRVIKRKKKHAEEGVWDARSRSEMIEDAAAKWRNYICLSDFRRFLKEACNRYGTEIIETSQDNSCEDCGEKIDFKEALYGECQNGHRQEKNKNAAQLLWTEANIPGKEDAPPLSLDLITSQGRKLIRLLENPLARAATAD
jgi:hypothetical protein